MNSSTTGCEKTCGLTPNAKSLSEKGADPLRRGKKTPESDSPPKGQTPFRIEPSAWRLVLHRKRRIRRPPVSWHILCIRLAGLGRSKVCRIGEIRGAKTNDAI